MLFKIDEVNQFNQIKKFKESEVDQRVLKTVRNLNERTELEPFITTILFDSNDTPHGPAELVDIYTHKLTVAGTGGMAAFILKGKSFKNINQQDISHQIYKLRKIVDLKYAVLGVTGTILDPAKEEFVATCQDLNIDYAIVDCFDFARLFIAYGFICPRDGERIHSGRCKLCGYSPTSRIKNVFQKETLKSLKYAHQSKEKEGLVILPPGSGKTRIAAEDAKEHATEIVLYVSHTHEILDVALSEFEAVFGKENIQYITCKEDFNATKKVFLTTIQFINSNQNTFYNINYDYIMIDEFHHAAANSYVSFIKNISYNYLLGLTATPYRQDNQDIFSICNGNVIIRYTLRDGIEKGILTPYHYYGCFDDVDYEKIINSNGNYDAKDLEKALIIPERDEAIVNKWIEMADQRCTIAFCYSIKHADRIVDVFNKHGISAKRYTSDENHLERSSIIKEFKRGKLKVLCTVDVLNEGADLPFVECLLFLRPTESMRIFEQQLGRGLRSYVGKTECLVIDFIGNFKNSYKIVEFHTLNEDIAESVSNFSTSRNKKEILNIPIGCKVEFDDRLIDLFVDQTYNPNNATRHNIGRILIYQYKKMWNKLGHKPSKCELDRRTLLDSTYYELVFGSWTKFQQLISD